MTQKVIWAVDPLSKERKVQAATLKTLLSLTKGEEAVIEPVAVLSPDQLKVPVAVFRGTRDSYREKAQEFLESWVKSLKNPRIVSPTLLVRDIFSERESVETLLNYAREQGAALIAVGTHVRTGLKRFLLGSFAEALILKSDIPTLIVGPKAKTPTRIQRILFPTDFGEASREAFERLLGTAAALKAKLLIYYKPDFLLPQTVVPLGAMPDYSQYLRNDIEEQGRKGARWADEARARGVKAEVVIDKRAGFVHESILKGAKRLDADLIAMASHSGRVSAAILGSVTRQVVRQTDRPVWVLHPADKEAAARAGRGRGADARTSVAPLT